MGFSHVLAGDRPLLQGRQDRGVARLKVLRQPDVEVDAVALADLASVGLLKLLAAHAAIELLHERADRGAVVAEGPAGAPQRPHGRQAGRNLTRVIACGDPRAGNADDAGLVAE